MSARALSLFWCLSHRSKNRFCVSIDALTFLGQCGTIPRTSKLTGLTMKCYKPGTDQEIELFCYANGVRLAEYEVPQHSLIDQDTIECVVAVSTGDRITIAGSFSGSVLHACFDVLADGNYVGDRRLEGSKTDEVKYIKSRKIEVKTVLDNPEEPGRTSILAFEKMVEGELHVKEMTSSDTETHGRGAKLGVGSLSVVASLSQWSEDKYNTFYPSMCLGSWQQRSQEGINNAGISPTHELELQNTKGEVSTRRATTHRRRFQQTRYGTEAWARVIFHYRSAAAIHKAGLPAVTHLSHALNPLVDRNKFKVAKQETNIFANRRLDMLRNLKAKVESAGKVMGKFPVTPKTRSKNATTMADSSKTQEHPSSSSAKDCDNTMEGGSYQPDANLDDFDVENLMALLRNSEQSGSDNALVTAADHGSRPHSSAPNDEQTAGNQQHMQQYQAWLEEQDFGGKSTLQDRMHSSD
nr:hypothetical protein CFP56_71062 [Quercus suber]